MPRKKITQQICHFVKVRKSQKQFSSTSILPKTSKFFPRLYPKSLKWVKKLEVLYYLK